MNQQEREPRRLVEGDSKGECALAQGVTFTVPFAVFLSLFSMYLSIAAHHPQNSDGGELAVAAVTRGLIHPPGYPLYALITSALVNLWPGNPFLTLSIFSAFSQAAAAGLLVCILRFFAVSPVLGALTAFSWGIHFFTITTGYDTEVFAFHNLLSAILVLVCQWSLVTAQSPLRVSLMIGVATGLCIAHHHMLVLWFPLVVAALSHQAQRLGGLLHLARTSCVAALAAVALALPFYLTLFGSYRRNIDSTPDTLVSLVHLVVYFLRIRYGTFSVGIESTPGTTSAVFPFLSTLLLDFPVVAAALVVLPLVLIRGRSFVAGGLLFSLVTHLWFVARIPVELGVIDQWSARFLSTPMYALIVCTSLSLASLRGRFLQAFFIICTCGAITRQALISGSLPDRSAADRAWEAAEKRIASLGAGGVLLIDDDFYHFRTDYFQRVQGMRRDLIIVSKTFLASQKYRSVTAAKIEGWSFDASCIARSTLPCRLISKTEIFELLQRRCKEGKAVMLSEELTATSSCEETVAAWRKEL